MFKNNNKKSPMAFLLHVLLFQIFFRLHISALFEEKELKLILPVGAGRMTL